jgi:hypothetical protein
MTIVDARFACQIVSTKGKAYLFDDVKCMKSYLANNEKLINDKSARSRSSASHSQKKTLS